MIERNEIIKTIAAHDVRWIRKNFYLPDFEDELQINILLNELLEYRKAQEKEKESKLPKTLLKFYDDHYSSNTEEIEKLQERIINDCIGGKQVILLHENLALERIDKLKKSLYSITGCDVYGEFDLGEGCDKLIKLLQNSNMTDHVFCCLSTANNTNEITSILMYLIGHFGTENISVVYESVYENREISDIMNKLGVAYDSYLGLGL